jgi:hypothetical protein
MTEPIKMPIQMDHLRELFKAAQDCADDLHAEVDAKYPDRETFTFQARRHARDMAVVHRVYSALNSIRSTELGRYVEETE